MFDVLEHIPDLGFLACLRTRSLAVAVPYCRYREPAPMRRVVRTWRMRLPNEHLHTSTASRWRRSSPTAASLRDAQLLRGWIRLRPAKRVRTSFRDLQEILGELTSGLTEGRSLASAIPLRRNGSREALSQADCGALLSSRRSLRARPEYVFRAVEPDADINYCRLLAWTWALPRSLRAHSRASG